MNPTATPTTNDNNNNVRVRKYGVCHGIGHDRRNCPHRQTAAYVEPDSQHPPPLQIVETRPSAI